MAELARFRNPFGPLCPNGCGGPGPHFVPPSLGMRGFYRCRPLPATGTPWSDPSHDVLGDVARVVRREGSR